MQLTEVFIKRPVSTIVLNLFLVAIGMILATKLETRNNPSISLPYITVSASCPNTSAAYMEKRVAQYIEGELKTIPNLESISSTNFPERSNIKLAFKLNSNIDNALNNVRDKIFNVSNYLPEETKVRVNRVDIDANPSIYLSITSDKHDDLALTKIIDQELVRPLYRLESVGSVEIMGGRYYTMYIEPISTKMLQYKLTPLEVASAVRNQNNDYSIGQIKDKINNFGVKVNSSLSSDDEFKNIIVKTFDDGTIIKLGDVAKVELRSQENTATIRHNQENALLLGIIKATDASVIDLSNKVKATLAKLQTTTCEGIDIKTFYDASLTVKSAINSVYKTIFESIIFVGIITFLFFASFRITLIPLIAIPISLIATFAAMYACGFSINTFTLLAMVLATGLVVDDAIVMLENIIRHTVELRKPTLQAAFDGSKEIYFAIIAMTLTLSAVFLPVGFLDNFVGKLFIEFAWTLSFCILFSGIVSLTLTPLMCAKFINANKMQSKQIRVLEVFSKLIIWLQTVYAKYLKIALNNKKKLYLICLISTLTLIFSFLKVQKTFGPIEDYGAFKVNFDGPQGFSLDDTSLVIDKIEKIFSNIEGIEGYLTVSEEKTKNSGFAIIVLTDWKKRDKSQEQIRKNLNQKLEAIPEMSIFARNFPSLVSMGGSGSNSSGIEFYILSSLEYNELYKISKSITDKMKKESNIFNPVSIETDIDTGYAGLELIINKEKAYQYNLEIADIIKTIQYLIGGQKIGDLTIGSNIYKVYMRYKLEDRNKVNSLHQIYIKDSKKDSKNGFVPLGSVAEIVETSETRSYHRYNNLRSIKISANLIDKTDKKQAKSIINSITANVIDHNTTKLEYIEKEAKELAQSTLLTFGLALLFIFLILSAQFESFLSAILILMAVPFSIVGAILALLIFKDSLNLYSGIGLITLIGLITKNSIMLVEFANQLVKQGMSVKDAVLESAQLRLRPILMTTLSTICGALPLIFTTGASAGACRSIGITIVGGMAVGSIFTSFIIPALYLTFNKDPRN